MSHLREETMDGYRSLIILGLALAVNIGCHYRDPSVDMLEGELRYMEDQVYMLEDELHKRCSQLDSCRQQSCNPCQQSVPTESLPMAPTQRNKPSSTPEYETVSDPIIEPVPDEPTLEDFTEDPNAQYELIEPMPTYEEEPTVEMPVDTKKSDPEPTRAVDEPVPAQPESVPAPSEYEYMDPQIEIPSSADSALEPTPTSSGTDRQPAELPEGNPPMLEEPDFDTDSIDDVDAPLDFSFRSITDGDGVVSDAGIDAHVTHVVAQAEIVTERGFDDEVTDADLLVVVEPRNKDGQYVELTGPVSIVVLDGKQSGSAARVARWDYDAGSARRAIRDSALGRGIHLELNWPDVAPDSDDLQLFVRYSTIEDRKLEADVRLESNPGRALSQGWQVVDRSPRVSSRESSNRRAGWNATQRKSDEKRSAILSGFKLQPIDGAEDFRDKEVEATTESLTKPEWSPFR